MTGLATYGRFPGEVERAAYRIVQESLTNVRRHAGSEASVTVSLEYGPDGLTVRVDDTGAGGDPSTSDGNGIPGMRERAAALGGTLTAGPGPDGAGFRVEAYLPVAPTDDPPTRGVGVIRVLLADDQALVRAGFRALLDAEEDIEIVGEAGDGAAAVRLAKATRPDLILMDIRMPHVDGLEATRQIAADPALADSRIVILTTFDLDEYVFEALRVGASGFLLKDTEPADLIRGVRAVAAGDALLSPRVTRRLIAEFAGRAKTPAPPASSTSSPSGSGR